MTYAEFTRQQEVHVEQAARAAFEAGFTGDTCALTAVLAGIAFRQSFIIRALVSFDEAETEETL